MMAEVPPLPPALTDAAQERERDAKTPVNAVAPPIAAGTMNTFVALMEVLETVSGRRAWVDAMMEKVPGPQRAEWALRRDGLAVRRMGRGGRSSLKFRV